MDDKEQIIKSLEPMFEKAEKEGKWFRSVGGSDTWLSPKELRKNLEMGFFIWGAKNWKLVDPKERLKDLEHTAKCAQYDLEQFKARMKA